MKKHFLSLLCLFLPAIIWAQKKVTTTNQVWLGSTNLIRFSNHWGTSADLQVRSRESFLEGVTQTTLRVGAVYFFNDAARLTLGHGFIENIMGTKGHHFVQDEHSPFQQFNWVNKYSHFSTSQSFRLEERFRHKVQGDKLVDGYSFNYRLRYNLLVSKPLSKKEKPVKPLDAVLYNEVYINFGKQIIYNTFDQYRFFAGFNFHATKHGTLQFGYLNIFQQAASGNKYRSFNIARIFYQYNIDFHKKDQRMKLPADVSYHSSFTHS